MTYRARKAAEQEAKDAERKARQQKRHERYGDTYTDKHGITWHWAASLECYVTIPEDND